MSGMRLLMLARSRRLNDRGWSDHAINSVSSWGITFGAILISRLFVQVTLSCSNPIVFRSDSKSPQSGTFASPLWPGKYPQDSRCIFKFVARDNERVVIKIEHFNIEGVSTSCSKDFMDIYIQVESVAEPLMDSLLLGRYCGHSLASVPNKLVSAKSVIVLDFFSDTNTQRAYAQDDHMGQLGFSGSYYFISEAKYFPGQLLPTRNPHNCDFLVDGRVTRSGIFQSPTYPGLYPNNLNCTYYFKGKPGDRVQLSFDDFDIFETRETCPVDYMLFYDGPTLSSPIIGRRFCGSKPRLLLYATGSEITVQFVTGDSRFKTGFFPDPNHLREIQRRGFKARFTFSMEYIQVTSQLVKNHIRGTECDIWIKSGGQSEGFLYSPGYPTISFPAGHVCSYYLYGVHNSQRMEIVTINIINFQLPHTDLMNNCKDGFLAVHAFKLSPSKSTFSNGDVSVYPRPDRVFCGTKTPETFVSSNPLLLIRLNSTQSSSGGFQGFKLHYKFKIDFGIQGHMVAPEVCHFVYNSQDGVRYGYINSPFYDNHYPNNSTCQYDFILNSREDVRLVFIDFHTAEEPSGVGRHASSHQIHPHCYKDYVQTSEVVPKVNSKDPEEQGILTYCGSSTPGPHVTDRRSSAMILRFRSDAQASASGFQVSYEFLPKLSLFKNKCGANLTSSQRGGLLSSPSFPGRYSKNLNCEWHIYPSRPYNKLILQFATLQIEGSLRSCANAVLRIYEGDNILPSSELCGTDSAMPAYHSNSSFVRLRFITSRKANSAKGFQIIWTELLPRRKDGRCPGFECQRTKHCIDRRLECNRVPNCGTYYAKSGVLEHDNSDEKVNCPVEATYSLLQVGLGVILTVVFLTIIVICILYREHRRTRNPKSAEDPLSDIQARKQLMMEPLQQSEVFHLTTTTPIYPPIQWNGTSSKRPSASGTLVREKLQKISIV